MNYLVIFSGTSEWIQNLSGIGTFIASVISLFTLFVLIKQRKDSFRPRIILDGYFEAICLTEHGNKLRTNWIDNYPNENGGKLPVAITLSNVGNGIAEKVEVIEYFTLYGAIKFIESLDKDSEFNFEYFEDHYRVSTNFEESFYIIFNKVRPLKLGVMLVRKDEKQLRVPVNSNFLFLLSCYDYLNSKHFFKSDILDKFPKLDILIKYEDMEGKEYTSLYECKVSKLTDRAYDFFIVKK